MSGFVAVARRGAPIDASVLHPMIAAAGRGEPDMFVDDDVALGAFRGRRGSGLAVAADLVVAADVRLDERASLDGLLGTRADDSDAERILRAWRRWGRHAPDRLIGDYAAAIWDRNARELMVIRDPMAGRPALVARGEGSLLAGSSVTMLLAGPGVERTLDERWIAAFLAIVPDYATRTGFGSVTRVLPGAIASARGDRWVQRTWYRLPTGRIRERDAEAYAARFRALFDEAVRCRLEGAARPAVALSGGLDSTSVLVSARATGPASDLTALAIPFSGRGDEQSLQRATAEMARARMRWVPLDGRHPFGAGPEATFRTYGTPPVSPNLFTVEALADAGADEGIDVALDGIDGDSVVGGTTMYLADLLLRLRWPSLLSELRAINAVHRSSRKRLLRSSALAPLEPSWMRRMRGRIGRRDPVPSFIDPGLARRARLRAQILFDGWRPWNTFQAQEELALSPAITPAVLESLDECWSRRGIEIAHPFLDRRLVEFCLGLPREQKIAGGYSKIVLRAAMAGRLPAEVAERADKADLSEPFSHGLSGGGRTFVLEGLSRASSNQSPWFMREAIEQIAEGVDHEDDGFAAFRIACIALWTEWLSGSTVELEETR